MASHTKLTILTGPSVGSSITSEVWSILLTMLVATSFIALEGSFIFDASSIMVEQAVSTFFWCFSASSISFLCFISIYSLSFLRFAATLAGFGHLPPFQVCITSLQAIHPGPWHVHATTFFFLFDVFIYQYLGLVGGGGDKTYKIEPPDPITLSK